MEREKEDWFLFVKRGGATCGICNHRRPTGAQYVMPGCMHTLCIFCVSQTILRCGANIVKCPFCRRETALDDLPRDNVSTAATLERRNEYVASFLRDMDMTAEELARAAKDYFDTPAWHLRPRELLVRPRRFQAT